MRGRLVVIVWIALAWSACAKGGAGDDGDDSPGIDAPANGDAPIGSADARISDASYPDATLVLPDAAVMADAGLNCTDSSQCGVGECCLMPLNICVPGEEPVPGFCLPN
jgi:hypothetical protein